MEHTFETDAPVELTVEIASGNVHVEARETSQSTVSVTGPRSDEVEVDLRGTSLSITWPYRTGFAGLRSSKVDVHVVVPTGSSLSAKLKSADLTADGTLEWVRIKSGSGDIGLAGVTRDVTVEVGSGDVRARTVGGDLRVRSGSGDVVLDRSEGAVEVTTGSGDVMVEEAVGSVQLKTGSGDLRVNRCHGDVDLTAASGDVIVNRMEQGRVRSRNASGDVSVRIPTGIPVWTDISTMTGKIQSTLATTGAPEQGQPYVEIRVTTLSGDIRLQNI
jgi:DUF4097 and DUF4098 domain-containing protein YvlB